MPGGRPTNYKPEYCNMLIKHMAEGFSFETFAADIGTHRQILYGWCKKHPEFYDAKMIGTDLGQKYWEKILKIAGIGLNELDINGKLQKIKPNAAILIFMMKNRFFWTDNPIPPPNHEDPYPEVE